MSIMPNLQAGPYLWEIDNPAASTPWEDAWKVGVVEDAPEEEWNPEFEEVVGDNLGATTIQDMLFQGANLFLSMVVQEFGTTAWRALQPYYNRQTPPGELNAAIGDGGLQSVGMFARATVHSTPSRVAAFRARAQALHPDFSSSIPYEIYFPRLSLAPNQPLTFRRGTRLKNVGVRFIAFPHPAYDDPLAPVENPNNPLVFYQTITVKP